MITLKETLMFHLMKVQEKLHARFKEHLNSDEMTYMNALLLLFIGNEPGLTQAKLAAIAHRDRNVIGQIIDKFEALEYVVRNKDEQDRRIYRLHLTAKGKARVDTFLSIIKKVEAEQLGCLDDDEKKLLLHILVKLALHEK